MKGYIYILSNPAMPGLLKIGFTDRTPDERAAELSASTGVPLPFKVAYSLEVDSAQRLEAQIHRTLFKQRLNDKREFFNIPLAEAIEAADSCKAKAEAAALAYAEEWQAKKARIAAGEHVFMRKRGGHADINSIRGRHTRAAQIKLAKKIKANAALTQPFGKRKKAKAAPKQKLGLIFESKHRAA